MDVHPVEPEFRVDGIHGKAQRQAELTVVGRLAALQGGERLSLGLRHRIRGATERRGRETARGLRRDEPFGRTPIRAAGVHGAVVPLELVERLDRAERESPVGIGHQHRQQDFLDLRARAAQRRHVDRVDLVDALDEDALAPVDDLPAEPQLQVRIADAEAPVRIRVEQVHAAEFLQVLEAVVVQRRRWPGASSAQGLPTDDLAGTRARVIRQQAECGCSGHRDRRCSRCSGGRRRTSSSSSA